MEKQDIFEPGTLVLITNPKSGRGGLFAPLALKQVIINWYTGGTPGIYVDGQTVRPSSEGGLVEVGSSPLKRGVVHGVERAEKEG